MADIVLEGITKRFGPIVAAEDVDLHVTDGEYVGILGPSGCGKTTLVKIIAGIWEPTAGRVLIDGQDMAGVPTEDRDLAYVFQEIALFPHLNVWGNATYGPRVKAWSPQRESEIGDDVLELVDLLDRKGFFPNELSGGAQQKVGLARALANQSKTLILDEPLSALDARVRLDLRYELRRLVKDLGLTALHVTHDQEEAMSVADRVVVMRAGRLVEVAPPQDLYRHPENVFTANFVGESNFLEGTVRRISDSWGVIALRNENFLRIPSDGFRVGDAVVLAVRPEHTRLSAEARPNAILGRVVNRRFMGSYLRHEVRAATGDTFLVDGPLSQKFNIHGSVSIGFQEEELRVFPMPPEGLREALKLE